MMYARVITAVLSAILVCFALTMVPRPGSPALPATASAQTAATMRLDASQDGSRLTVDLLVSDAPPLGGFLVILVWDPSALVVTNAHPIPNLVAPERLQQCPTPRVETNRLTIACGLITGQSTAAEHQNDSLSNANYASGP